MGFFLIAGASFEEKKEKRPHQEPEDSNDATLGLVCFEITRPGRVSFEAAVDGFSIFLTPVAMTAPQLQKKS